MLAAAVSPRRLRAQLEDLTDSDLELLRARMRWKRVARAKQIPPTPPTWDFFGVKSGRGFGKTLCAANWLVSEALADPGSINFVIAPTHEDLIGTCFYGPTGLHGSYLDKATGEIYPVTPPALIKSVTKSPPMIYLINDAVIRGFSAERPERLRGPQAARAWLDEVASWRYPMEVWDNLIFGLRLGKHPQVFWTGTPKPKPFINMLVKLPNSITVSGSTYENADNLPDTFYENIAKYEGTKIGRQEIYGEIIDPEEAGFVKRSDIRLWPANKPLPKFRFIILSLDTAFTEETWNKKDQEGDPTASTVWGLFEYEGKEHIMLLDAWEDYLGFPQLVRRVKLERTKTFGDADEPVYRTAFIDRARRPKHTGRPADLLLIEDKGSGISLRQQLAVEGIITEIYNPGNLDKLSRLHAVSPLFPHGRIWCIESAKRPNEFRAYAEPVVLQLCTYVGEGSLERDDLLDTSTQALLYMMHKFKMRFTVRADVQLETQAALQRIKRKQRRNPYDG